jgi:glycosyltransferase involved in cell wall biosynthesis
MQEAAQISFIIPVLNEERLLMRLLEQFTPERRTKYGLEIILSDGGSTDGTPKVIAEARERGFVTAFVQHTAQERRQTIAEGRNAGAALASAPILVLINADTLPQSMDALCESVLAWANDAHLAQISPAATTPVRIAPEERVWSDVVFHAFMNTYVQALNLLRIGMGRGECQIIRRADFEAVGGYDARIVAGEDFDLYTKLRKRGTITWLPKALVYESPRRFRKYGYVRIVWRWFSNSIAVMLLGRSVAAEWELIRE